MTVAAAAPRAGVSVPKSAPPRENLYRLNRDIAITRTDGDAMPTLTGHFAVWDQWTEIRSAYEGNFMERFSPGSMTKTLTEGAPKVLFQHGKDPTIGEKVLGPVRTLEPDNEGAYYEVPLFDTSYNRDLIPGLEAGQYGASFRFKVMKEDFVRRPQRSDWNPRGLPERTVLEAQVSEFGPVTFPAYLGATAGVRSLTDEFLLATLAEDEELQRRAGISLAGVFERVDAGDIWCLTQMLSLGATYLAGQDETDDATDIKAMTGILHQLTGLIDGEIDEPAEPDDGLDEMFYGTDPGGEQRAEWTTEYIDNLPDSSFLYIEPGGDKDTDGKTKPRSLRHFPYKDAAGAVDLPHLRDALARIPQSSLSQSVKDDATAKADKILAAEGGRSTEPDPSAGTTPTEPEPSEATTRSDARDLLWFARPDTRKGAR